MVALDATAIIHSAKEIRQMPIQDLFVSAREDILHMHRLGPGQILTSVEIPLTKLQRSTFVKSAMRNSWDFALASVAVSLRLIDGLCQDSRIVLGAVAATPWRCFAAERIMDGQRPSHAIVEAAANAATEGAQSLRYNEYKVALTRSLVRDALAEVFA
jgi:xanthine dehydrogenase YagS FAD-binding subunit